MKLNLYILGDHGKYTCYSKEMFSKYVFPQYMYVVAIILLRGNPISSGNKRHRGTGGKLL